MKRAIVFVPALMAVIAGLAARNAQPVASGWEGAFPSDKENQMMRAYLRARVHAALDERQQRVEALSTPEEISAYQKRLRDFFRETTDLDFFERTPLRSQVTGRLERQGYSIDKVIFESQPGFHVTGNLYRPAGRGPFPAILHPCGHTENGKAAGAYQQANLLLVRHGFVVLCYDPIGQGERKQLLNPKTGKGLYSGSSEHQLLGVAPLLLGRGLSSYMIWDAMRAIDFLESRPEVDRRRIGCTGNSGGGNLTSFLMALDDRIQAAAPGCFMTTTRLKNESPGPGDAEQNLYGQIRAGLDHPDFAILRAPKPTLILAATEDYVPIQGTWDAFRQAKRIYTKLGYPERVDLVEAPDTHGFSRRLREGAVRFLARWLKGETIEAFEPALVAAEKENDLLCTPKGQVLAMAGERSIFDLNRERADVLAAGRKVAWQSMAPEAKRAQIRSVTGIRFGLPQARVIDGPAMLAETGSGLQVTASFIYETERGIKVPMLRTHQSKNREPSPNLSSVHLVCLDAAWNRLQVPASEIIPPHASAPGGELVIVNLRDSGFSKTRNWRFQGADQWIALMLGTSYLAMRTEDLICVATALRRENKGRPIHLYAEAEFVPAALHATALEPELFESVTLHGGVMSWETTIDSRDPARHLHQVMYGALRHYDLRDLLELIPQGKVTLSAARPVAPRNAP